MSPPPRLVTISISHFCEKARWALDRADVDYVEEAHAPFFHLVATRLRGPSSSTPQLFVEGRRLGSSTEIVRYADRLGAALYPTDPTEREAVDRWVDRLDYELGPHVRRYAYHSLLDRPDLYLPLFEEDVPRIESVVLSLVHRRGVAVMRRAMRIDEEGARRSRAKIDAILADVDASLGRRGRYLVGDRFTAADLTLAALLVPLVQAPESRYAALREATFPAELSAHADALRASPAGRAVADHYAKERRRNPLSA